MPTGVYVRKNAVEDRLKAGMAAEHAADFAQWLRERRYTPRTIVERMRLLASWTHWARAEGYALAAIREAYAASFALIEAGHRPRFRGDVNQDAVETAKLFVAYLEDRGVLACLRTGQGLLGLEKFHSGRAGAERKGVARHHRLMRACR